MQDFWNKIEHIALWVKKLLVQPYWDNIVWTNTNSSGDNQVPMDVITDQYIFEEFSKITNIKEVVSEERDGAELIDSNWKYCIAYDPLDWSSLADVNLTVWTIIWIYEDNFTSVNLVGAAYILYWPRIEIVECYWTQVFHKQYLWKKFIKKSVSQLNEKWRIISPWGLYHLWKPYHKNMIESFYLDKYVLRYSWAFVVEIHHLIFKWWWLQCYPEIEWKPDWKLRKLFEVFPLAFIFEALWWKAIDKNWVSVLKLDCWSLHESTSCYMWTDYEIEKVKKFLPSFSQ